MHLTKKTVQDERGWGGLHYGRYGDTQRSRYSNGQAKGHGCIRFCSCNAMRGTVAHSSIAWPNKTRSNGQKVMPDVPDLSFSGSKGVHTQFPLWHQPPLLSQGIESPIVVRKQCPAWLPLRASKTENPTYSSVTVMLSRCETHHLTYSHLLFIHSDIRTNICVSQPWCM